MLRINNLGKWTCLQAGQMLDLTSERKDPRRIRIEVNTDRPTRFDVVTGDAETGERTFLGVVLGLETLEFTAGGDIHLIPDTDGETWFFTNDGDVPSYTIEEPEIFTKIAQRKARNPELERMMWKMEENLRRRLDKQADEIAARDAAVRAREAALAEADPETGEIKDGGGKVGGGATDGAAAGDGGKPSGDAAKKADGADGDATAGS